MLYFQQKKDYTCGCASLLMALSNFIEFNKLPSELELEIEMGTNDRVGTHPQSIIKSANDRGLQAIYGENGDYDILNSLLLEGYVVILMISVDVPHYVVVDKINDTHIFFKDPYFGSRMVRDKKKFISDKQIYPNYRWKVLDKEFKKYLPEYDFSSIESVRGWIAIKQ